MVPLPALARKALSRQKDDTRKARVPGARLRVIVRSPTPGGLSEPYWEASTSKAVTRQKNYILGMKICSAQNNRKVLIGSIQTNPGPLGQF